MIKNIHKDLSKEVYDKIKEWFPNHRIGKKWYLTKYVKGGYIDYHCDNHVSIDNIRSKYTILIYLNDDYEGGRLCFSSTDTKDNSTKDSSTKDNSTKDNSTKDNSTKDSSTKDSSVSNDKEENKENKAEDKEGSVEIAKLKVRAGTAVIMDQDLWHKAEPLISGTKYLLRADMIKL